MQNLIRPEGEHRILALQPPSFSLDEIKTIVRGFIFIFPVVDSCDDYKASSLFFLVSRAARVVIVFYYFPTSSTQRFLGISHARLFVCEEERKLIFPATCFTIIIRISSLDLHGNVFLVLSAWN